MGLTPLHELDVEAEILDELFEVLATLAVDLGSHRYGVYGLAKDLSK